MEEGFDDISNGMNKVVYVAQQIEVISEAFFETGNRDLGKRLLRLSNDLYSSEELVSHATDKIVATHVIQAFQSSDNMLNACLAGATLARSKSDKKAEL